MSEFNSDYVTIRKKNPKRQCKEETFCEWDNEFAQTGNNVSTGMNPVGKTSEGNADYVTIKKKNPKSYAVVRGTAPAPVAESYTESGDESKRSKKIRKVMKFMVRRRYELPTVSSRSKQRSTKAYEPSTNKAHIPFVTSKSATPSHNVGLNIQQVKELNMLKLGKITVTLPKYKSMSFDQLLRLYESNNVIVGKFLKTASCRKRRPSLKRINPSKALTFKCHTEDSDDLIDQQSFSSRPPR
ncbi:hypothetical protein RR46_08250 [Papilio xuthus]|uniref:Uncharacterized protein n=1 Tax=Papilio xuthus TaxID=66420 RepID=A0A194PGI8_PAPXU|nr:hypothetical protein RR46_08250 [Papilio xuthus]